MISFQSCGVGYPPKSILGVAASSQEKKPVFEFLCDGKHSRIFDDGSVESIERRMALPVAA